MHSFKLQKEWELLQHMEDRSSWNGCTNSRMRGICNQRLHSPGIPGLTIIHLKIWNELIDGTIIHRTLVFSSR